LLPSNNISTIFRVIIAGGRDFKDYQLLNHWCDKLLITKRVYATIVVVSGKQMSEDEEGNKWGADYFGEVYAEENGFKVDPYPADWKKHGKAAGFIRNDKMSQHADGLIAFWDGHSRGTKNMIDLATKRGLLVKVINYNQ